MQLSDFLTHSLAPYSKLARKRDTLNRVKNANHQNLDIINIHRYDPTNIGDFYCAPHHYFDLLKGKYLDIFDYKREEQVIRNNWVDKINSNALIIGGGGLLNREGFDLQMKLFESLNSKGKKTVLWGVGHNAKSRNTFGKVDKYTIDTSKFGLVGVRDYGMKEEWVPCASCLHPIFDQDFSVKNEIGIIFHKKTINNKTILNKFSSFPSTSNNAVFEDVIRFIGETETILTDSYHAMYWSLLMGKKVMVFPNSSKFYQFKYKPVISSFDSFQSDLKKLHTYQGVLEDCRTTNLKFADKVFDYLDF